MRYKTTARSGGIMTTVDCQVSPGADSVREMMRRRQDAFQAERLAKISLAMDRAARADRYLANKVRDAHDAGLSWTEIAQVLGVSRQAARQRYTRPEVDR